METTVIKRSVDFLGNRYTGGIYIGARGDTIIGLLVVYPFSFIFQNKLEVGRGNLGHSSGLPEVFLLHPENKELQQ